MCSTTNGGWVYKIALVLHLALWQPTWKYPVGEEEATYSNIH